MESSEGASRFREIEGRSTELEAALRPRDTSPDTWSLHRAVLSRLGGARRLELALDLSESIRSIQLAGILARNPQWKTADAVRHLIMQRHGIELPPEDQ